MHVLLFLLFGLIVGALARMIVPGKEPGGWVVSLVIGVAGSYLGGFIGRALGTNQAGENTAGFIGSLIGAIVLAFAYHAYASRGTLRR